MKRLLFTFNHEVIIFDINNKEIMYRDRKWPQGIRFIPKDVGLVKMIVFSRNKLSSHLIKWIEEANSGKSLEEWNACVDDNAVVEIVKRDAKLKGCVFRKEFTEEELRIPSNIPDSMIDKVPISFTEPESENNVEEN